MTAVAGGGAPPHTRSLARASRSPRQRLQVQHQQRLTVGVFQLSVLPGPTSQGTRSRSRAAD
eukprot:7390064-Prymnesium_polylepis.1